MIIIALVIISFQIYYWKIDKSCKIYIFLALIKIKKIKILSLTFRKNIKIVNK